MNKKIRKEKDYDKESLKSIHFSELSDFLKLAYKNGDVKDYQKVKNTDPELNEEYEFPGFYVGEQIAKYPAYDIGDIVFIKNYKYDKNKSGKNHLFVVVDKDNHAVSILNFCMIISSNLYKLKFSSNVLLKKDNLNQLHKDSIVKTDKIYKFHNDDITGLIGKIDKDIAIQYKELYIESKGWRE